VGNGCSVKLLNFEAYATRVNVALGSLRTGDCDLITFAEHLSAIATADNTRNAKLA
jgi:hypothetical protein